MASITIETAPAADHTLPSSTDRSPPRPRLPYLPGLDGLRAIAVAGVLLYHGQAERFSGGFLGVEVFFVLSGYLITSLILDEHARSGRISLGGFWVRRARRLLPALFAFLAGATLLAALVAQDALTKIREGVVGAAFYVANWAQIARGESYGEAFERPSFLGHLWSLAVEEQFYLLWPIALAVGLRYLGPKMSLRVVVAGWAASTLWMWWLARGLADFEDPTRIYVGTDTRIAGLLLGAAAAFVWRPWVQWGERARTNRARLDAFGVAGLVGILLVFVSFEFSANPTPDELDRLYPWGFVLVGFATIATIVAVTTPGSRLARVLGNPMFRAVGARSYAIYLWHYPVFLLTRPRVDVEIDGWELWAVRLALTAILAELSYQLVERPVRERRFLAGLSRLFATPPRRVVAQGLAAAFGVLVIVGGLHLLRIDHDETVTLAATGPVDTTVAAEAEPAVTTDPTSAGTESTTEPTTDPAAVTPPPTEPAAAPPDPATATTLTPPVAAAQVPPAVPETTVPVAPAVPTSAVTFIGDSVLEGAAPVLVTRMPEAVIDARRGRQWWDLPAEIRAIGDAGRLGSRVVIHIGNNGTVTDEIFDQVMAELSGVERVYVVTVRVPREWEGEVNAGLARAAGRYPGLTVIDWRGVADPHSEFFGSDGVHLGSAGRAAYAELMAATLAA